MVLTVEARARPAGNHRIRKPGSGAEVPGLAARQAAARLLAAVIDARTPLDGLTDNEHGHPQYRALDGRDRALVRAILVTALRHRMTIAALLARRLEKPLPSNATTLSHILHVAAAQILFLDIPDSAASRAPAEPGQRPVFFERDGEAHLPEEACRSPWNPGATNGIAVAGLLMHALELVEAPGVMLPAHLTIDILRPVPFAPTLARSEVTRAGKSLQMVETHLIAGDTPVARARLLRVREEPSPSLDAPMTWPALRSRKLVWRMVRLAT